MMKKMQIKKKFWSVKELATCLQVSKSLIYDKISKNEIPCRRLGKRILIPSSYVEILMTA